MLAQHDSLPQSTIDMVGKIILLEATPGAARRKVLQQWLQGIKQRQETMNWLLACDFNDGGAWAGLQDLLQDIVTPLEQSAPTLLMKHGYELRLAVPALQERVQVAHPTLTDTSEGDEHVRNYPQDRAYRSLHGLIDFLDSWYTLSEKKPMVIICDQYDQACPLVQHFFMELLRRRGQKLQLTLLLAVAPGQSRAIIDRYPLASLSSLVQLDLPPDPIAPLSREYLTQAAQELEQQVEQDLIVADTFTPRLISLLEQSKQSERALYWKIQAVSRFDHFGLYEAGLRYCAEIDAQLDLIYHRDPRLYSLAVLSLYFCYVPLGYIEQAYTMMTKTLTNYVHKQPFQSHCEYLMAMLHARFLSQRDLLKAIDYLEQGQTQLSAAHLPESVYYFNMVFLSNGLAYIRAQQKQPEEAIALCRNGLGLLDQHLLSDQHRLHRSVLLYNIAQVYAATHQLDSALVTFEAVMERDPNYSEYYNDRGSIYMQMGRFSEAEQDYLQAIELSPPYPEVWINLGQCYREMERVDDAITAYTRALDLSPTEILPLVARAEMYAERGRWQEALVDYHAALQIEPQAPLVLAARAVAYYESGQVELAIADLDAAVTLSPKTPVFYQNRAAALLDLGHVQAAAQDLRMYLHLEPDAEDSSEVEQQLLLLA